MSAAKRELKEVAEGGGAPARVAVENLFLDPENPRLSSGDRPNTQEELVRVLWYEMAVDEVAFSIAANGFFPEEPLLVIPKEAKGTKDKEQYTVVEGNRRLAAVLLLRDAKLRNKVKATDLPTIDAERRRSLDSLPVSIYPNRQSLWTYCGFRHINGTKPWDAFSKAKYVASVHEQYEIPLSEIADKIGDRHATVIRLYRGYKILQQAEEQAGFDVEDRVRNRFYFSHLYTAVDQPEFQKFLGITGEGSLKTRPVPKSRLTELGELMTWLYGKKSTGLEPMVRSQNPDLNILRQIISKSTSLSALRSGYSLARSLEIAIGDQRRFREALIKAKEELQQATGTVITGYTGEEDLYQALKDIQLYAEKLGEEMEKKRKGSKH